MQGEGAKRARGGSPAAAGKAAKQRTAAGAAASPAQSPAPSTPQVVGAAAAPTPDGTAGGEGAAPARPRRSGEDGTHTIEMRDLTAALERDPQYAKSCLLYQVMESEGL